MDQGTQRLITRHNEQMRELIVRDIDALENKLNVKRQVSHMADGAVDKVKGTLGMNYQDPNQGWGGFVRHNAVPLAAIGLGGTLLARNLRQRMDTDEVGTIRPQQGEYTSTAGASTRTYDEGNGSTSMQERASAKLGSMQESASEGLDTAKEKLSDAGTMVSDTASTARDSVTSRAVHAKEIVVERMPDRAQAKRMAHDHSQLLGVAALVAGAVAGAFIPRTRAEQRTLAPVQDRMKEQASGLVETGVEKAKETADRAAEAVKTGAESAKEEFAESGDEDVTSESGEAATTPESLPNVTQPNRITGGSSSSAARPATMPSGGSSGGTGSSSS